MEQLAPNGRNFMETDITVFFSKNCGEKSSLNKIGQEKRVLYMKTYIQF